MHEYICMMASISQPADRLWPDMTAQRLVTWQPTMLVSNTKITSATQRSWIVASYDVHSVTFAVCWHFSRVHTFVLTYLCNLRPPPMLAERTLRQSDETSCFAICSPVHYRLKTEWNIVRYRTHYGVVIAHFFLVYSFRTWYICNPKSNPFVCSTSHKLPRKLARKVCVRHLHRKGRDVIFWRVPAARYLRIYGSVIGWFWLVHATVASTRSEI